MDLRALKNIEVDSETILITLDQVNQTIDVLANVVSRLQSHVQSYTEQTEQLRNTEHVNVPTSNGSTALASPALSVPLINEDNVH